MWFLGEFPKTTVEWISANRPLSTGLFLHHGWDLWRWWMCTSRSRVCEGPQGRPDAVLHAENLEVAFLRRDEEQWVIFPLFGEMLSAVTLKESIHFHYKLLTKQFLTALNHINHSHRNHTEGKKSRSLALRLCVYYIYWSYNVSESHDVYIT